MTHLRKRMLEELQRRNYSEGTTGAYLQAIKQFAVHFGKSPDKSAPDDLRSYQAYLLVERKLAVASVVARVGVLLALSLAGALSGQQSPEMERSADHADVSETMAHIEAIQKQFVAAASTAGECGIPAPKIVIEDVPSFGAYDPETNKLTTSAWSQLSSNEHSLFYRLVGPGASEKQAHEEFETGAHHWVVVHELGHWWQACRSVSSNTSHYRVEYGANRIAAAYWTEKDPSLIAHQRAVFQAILRRVPNPLPNGQTVESYFDANYEKLGPTPAYIWFQARMCLTAFDEKPSPPSHRPSKKQNPKRSPVSNCCRSMHD